MTNVIEDTEELEAPTAWLFGGKITSQIRSSKFSPTAWNIGEVSYTIALCVLVVFTRRKPKDTRRLRIHLCVRAFVSVYTSPLHLTTVIASP